MSFCLPLTYDSQICDAIFELPYGLLSVKSQHATKIDQDDEDQNSKVQSALFSSVRHTIQIKKYQDKDENCYGYDECKNEDLNGIIYCNDKIFNIPLISEDLRNNIKAISLPLSIQQTIKYLISFVQTNSQQYEEILSQCRQKNYDFSLVKKYFTGMENLIFDIENFQYLKLSESLDTDLILK